MNLTNIEDTATLHVTDIRNVFAKKFVNNDFVIDKSGCSTIDIIGARFEADESVVFGLANEGYVRKELEWYLSQSLNVNDLEDTPKIWKDVSDKDGYINSNYGWCVFSKDNISQYENCLMELRRNPLSRRAVMIYNRPSMWVDYNKNGMSDFMCTFSTQHFIRDGKLISLVFMRSNDVVFGYRNDYAWQKYVHDALAGDLEVEAGTIIWNAGSLHLYDRHFYLVDHYVKTGIWGITHREYKNIYE